jgi:hypothetical protein
MAKSKPAVTFKSRPKPLILCGLGLALGPTLMSLAMPAALAQKVAPPKASNPIPAALPFAPPAITIPLGPLGYKLPRSAPPYESSPSEELYFVDSDHILVTFRIPELLERLPDCPPNDEDRTIHAVILDLPSGKVEAAANWRLHDQLQYLWPLSGGRFLVRQHSRLMVTDAELKLHPFLKPVSRLESVQVSRDGRYVVVETAFERHTSAAHQTLIESLKLKGVPTPKEDVRVMVVDSERRTVIAESREPQVIPMRLIRDGYVETVRRRSSRWALHYVPFGGVSRTVIEFTSKCEPQMEVLNADALLLENCPTTGGGNGLLALSLEGKPLWSIRPDRALAIPHLTLSPAANAVALSRIRLANPVDMWISVIHDENIVGQQIDLLDATTGKIQLEAMASPARIYGQDYALSPDGQRLAVLKTDRVQVFEVQQPPVISTISEAEQK